MTNEQREAIDKLTNGEKMDFVTLVRTFKKEGIEKFAVVRKEYLDTVLSLIKEQQGKIQKKDKQIDLMVEKITMTKPTPCTRTNEFSMGRMYMSKEEIKQYFADLVEKEN